MDISEAKIVEPLDILSELQKLCMVAFDGIVFHEKGKVISANTAALELFSLTHDEICATPVAKLFTVPEGSLDSGIKKSVRMPLPGGKERVLELDSKRIELGGRFITATSVRDSTDTFAKETSLNRYRELMESIVCSSFDIMLVYSRASESLLFANEKVKEILGRDAEDFLIDSDLLWEIVHEDDIAAIRGIIAQTEQVGRGARVVKLRLLDSHGTWLWFEASFLPFPGGTDEVLIILRDIHETVDAYVRLERSEALFRSVYETSSVGIMLLSPELRFIACNKAYSEIVGYSSDELSSMKLMDITRTEFSTQNMSFIAQMRDKVIDTYSFEKEYVTKSGKTRWISAYCSALRDERGEITMFIGMATDIHARKKHEGRLRFLSYAVEQSPFEIVLTDRDCRVRYVNRGFEVRSGYSLSDIEGKHLSFLQSDRNDPSVYEAIESALRSRSAWKGELVMSGRSGKSSWVNINVSPVFGDNGEPVHFMAIIEDITEQKLIRGELERATAAARRADNAKSEFLSNMSHELRTPLNAIAGIVYLLEKSGLSDTQRDYLQKITHSSSFLLRMVNDILDLAKIESGKLELESVPFSVGEVFEAVSFAVAGIYDSGDIECVFIGAHLVGPLVGDRFRLEQILMNLLGNAVKFTEKGSIVVSVETWESADGKVVVGIDVSDTGIGIDSEKIGRIFDTFSQADSSITRRYGGSGLGLSITKKIVERMGGTIDVKSVSGEGSSFRLRIPFVSGGQAVPVEPRDDAFALVLDSGSLRVRSLCGILSSLGIEHRVAERIEDISSMPSDRKMCALFIGEDLYGLLQPERMTILPADCVVTVISRTPTVDGSDNGSSRRFIAPPFSEKSIGRIFDAGESVPSIGVPAASRSIRRVLLVDDDSLNIFVSRRIFEREGFTVDTAVSGLDALERIGAAGEAVLYDIIVTDLHMPDLDGLETARRIRALPGYADVPLYILSADAMRSEAADCPAFINGYLVKPISPDELFRITGLAR